MFKPQKKPKIELETDFLPFFSDFSFARKCIYILVQFVCRQSSSVFCDMGFHVVVCLFVCLFAVVVVPAVAVVIVCTSL